MDSIKRLYCALRGHEDYLRYEKNRVYLQCVACGHESPGWTVETERPVLHFTARPPAETAAPALIRSVA